MPDHADDDDAARGAADDEGAEAHEIPAWAALRVLLSTGLRSQHLATALAWQVEQGWRVVEAMERGDRRKAPRSALTASYEKARTRLLRETRG